MERLRQLGWCSGLLLILLGCAQTPVSYPPSRGGAEVIDLHMGYPEAFDRVARALEREGYQVEVADDRVGLIRTVPKTREGAGGVSYKVAVIVRMGGTDQESWLAVDQIAVPSFPEDEQRLKNLLKGLAP
jgi:hypothetical protein